MEEKEEIPTKRDGSVLKCDLTTKNTYDNLLTTVILLCKEAWETGLFSFKSHLRVAFRI